MIDREEDREKIIILFGNYIEIKNKCRTRKGGKGDKSWTMICDKNSLQRLNTCLAILTNVNASFKIIITVESIDMKAYEEKLSWINRLSAYLPR